MSKSQFLVVPDCQTLVVLNVGRPNPSSAGSLHPSGARCQRAKPWRCRSTGSRWCQASESQTPAVPDIGQPNLVYAGVLDPGSTSEHETPAVPEYRILALPDTIKPNPAGAALPLTPNL